MAYNVNDCVEVAMGCTGKQRRGVDVQAACTIDTARKDDAVPRMVPRAATTPARIVR